MRQLLRIIHKFFLAFSLLSALVISCDKDMTVSLEGTNEDLGVEVMDSMSVYASTYQLLDLPSAASGTILVGKASNAAFGSVESSSYFTLALPSVINDIPTDAQFDSINLVLKPKSSRYFYGDTTQMQKFTVHRVTEDIVLKNITNNLLDPYSAPIYVTGPTLFSNQKFNYNTTALGQITFSPKVRSLDSLNIRLDQSLGLEIYNMFRNNDVNVATSEAFKTYLQGMVIVPDDNNTTILGLNDTLKVNLNYSFFGADGFKKTATKTLSLGNKAYQYNNISYNRSSSPIANLNSTNREIKSSSTSGNVIIQAGTGIVAKINIPSLNEFMYKDNIAINKIEMVVETKEVNSVLQPRPASLMLLVGNERGIPYTYVPTPFAASIQQVSYIPSNQIGVNGKYVFNLIEYVKSINSSNNRGSSLYISAASPALFSTMNTAEIATEDGKPKIKLNIVYTKFK